MDHIDRQIIQFSIQGDVDNVTRLINAGARITQDSVRILTPLYWACAFGHVECVQVLLENGADANEQYKNGCSILICTILSSNLIIKVRSVVVDKERFLHVVQLLVDHNADVNFKIPYDFKYRGTIHPSGSSILKFAKQPDIVNFLVERGATE